eukprot:470991_1
MSSFFLPLQYVYIWIISFIWLIYGDLQMPFKEAASKHGIFIGSVSGMNQQTNESMLAEQYSLVTSGNPCKWQATEPKYNVFNFTDCDYVYNQAVLNNQTFRGHNLCWGQYNPKWLVNGNYNASQLKSILKNHIITVMNHYKTKYNELFYAWDVVNEAINDPPYLNESAIFKTNVWYPTLPNYVELAFEYAHSVANGSNVKLFYNDFNITMDTGYTGQKADAVYKLLKNMINSGIKVDGIGFEGHMNIGEYENITKNYQSIVRNFQRFADLGLEIHITEMDIMCGQYENGILIPCQNFTDTIATKQAEMYQTLLRACLSVKKCKNYETWGMTDRSTWRGSDEYPLPFDYNYKPKCAAYYIENALLNISNSNCTDYMTNSN